MFVLFFGRKGYGKIMQVQKTIMQVLEVIMQVPERKMQVLVSNNGSDNRGPRRDDLWQKMESKRHNIGMKNIQTYSF